MKRYLFTPGPTPVPPRGAGGARRAGRPPPQPRLPADLRAVPRAAARRSAAPRRTCCSSPPRGRARSSRRSRTSSRPGEPHLVVSAGNFGERWVAMTTAYGADVDALRVRVGRDARPRRRRARGSPSAARRPSGSCSPRPRPASSPTCRRSPPPRRRPARSSSSTPSRASAPSRCETDAWGLDVVVSGSQKALMTPPGLGLAAVSEAALAATGSRRASTSTGTAHAQGAGEARRAVHAAGLARRRARRRARPAARRGARGGVRPARAPRPRLPRGRQGDGLELFSPDEDRSAVVTAVRVAGGRRRRPSRGVRDRFGDHDSPAARAT